MRSLLLVLPLALAHPWAPACTFVDEGEGGPTTQRVTQDGSGPHDGADERALQSAVDALPPEGGVVLVGPGRYALRRPLRLRSGVTLRGEPGALLALPSPTRVRAAAAAGTSEVTVADAGDLAPDTGLELLPPSGRWPAEVPREATWLEIAAIDGDVLRLVRPLAIDVPAGSRLGYHEKMIAVLSASDVVIECLTIDGGRVEGIPMPGHQKRSAVWIGSHFSHEKGPIAPPCENVVVQNCEIKNCYGRAVAVYNAVDCAVLGCKIRSIADEAIDFDHFTYRCRAAGNDVEDAVFGVAINDGSDNVVEFNRLRSCRVGITVWWLSSLEQEGLNRGNVLRHNRISASEEASIRLGKNCHENVVELNRLDRPVEAAESSNRIERNVGG